MAAVFVAGWLTAKMGVGEAVEFASLSDRERAFTERMRGASLVGYFTVDGREDRNNVPDRYDISSVEKLDGDRWRFNMRMRHSTVDVTLPVVLPIVWVGNTPMIDITDFDIPGLGTFTVRLLFDEGRYAGTWANPKVGGLMFGRIEKQQN
jgi:hypothetical protein